MLEHSELKEACPHTRNQRPCLPKVNFEVTVCEQEVHGIQGSWGASQVRHSTSFSSKPNSCLDASLARDDTAEGAVLLCGLVPLLTSEGVSGSPGAGEFTHPPLERLVTSRVSFCHLLVGTGVVEES